MKHLICALMLVFMIPNHAFAEDSKLDKFLGMTYIYHKLCSLSVDIFLNSSSTMEKPTKCIDESKKSAKKDYSELIDTINKNEKVNSMVKDYYAFWITSMDAIIPVNDELKFRYKERIDQDRKKLSEMSERIKLEF